MLDTLNKTAMLAVLALLSIALLTRLPPSMVDDANDQLQRFHPGWKVPNNSPFANSGNNNGSVSGNHKRHMWNVHFS